MRSRIVIAALLPALVVLACPVYADEPQFSGTPCGDSVKSLLDQWSSQRTWVRAPDLEKGVRVDRTPTEKTGVWLETRVYADGKIEALRITAHTTTTVTWQQHEGEAGCQPQLSILNRSFNPARLKKAFTDDELVKLLDGTKNGQKSGMIYVWSPHMPLSLRGFKEAKAAAQKTGLSLIVVLDPYANKKYASTTAKSEQLPEDSLRALESTELLNRGMTNHYPVIQLFGQGKLVGPTVPGFKTQAFYERFIREQLGDGQ